MGYYSFASNFNRLSSIVHYTLKRSCTLLLTAKFKLNTQAKTYSRLGKDLKGKDKHGFIKAEYGINTGRFKLGTVDPLLRLYAEGISKASLDNLACQVCGSDYRVEMHHVRMLKDLNPKISYVDKIMAAKRRKQIPLCRACHMKHHSNAKMNLEDKAKGMDKPSTTSSIN